MCKPSRRKFLIPAIWSHRNSSDVRIMIMYNDSLAHLIYAASDIIVMPSMFEPCGLTQLVAMRCAHSPTLSAHT